VTTTSTQEDPVEVYQHSALSLSFAFSDGADPPASIDLDAEPITASIIQGATTIAGSITNDNPASDGSGSADWTPTQTGTLSPGPAEVVWYSGSGVDRTAIGATELVMLRGAPAP